MREEIDEKEINEILGIMERFGVSPEEVIQHIINGRRRGLSLHGCIEWARLNLALEYGRREWFSLDDAAAILNCTVEQVADNIRRIGIHPAEMSAAEGFEWILQSYRPMPD